MNAMSNDLVLVVGSGNAALCAAVSAAESGARVHMLERAPEDARGGNSAYTGAAFRVVYDGLEDLRRLVPDLGDEEAARSDFGRYTAEQFFDELIAMSNLRADAELVGTLVDDSLDTLLWMRTHGVRFIPIHGRQSFVVDGKHRFWGGLTGRSRAAASASSTACSRGPRSWACACPMTTR